MKEVLLIENCISYWQSTLSHDGFLLSPSVQVLVETTLGYLKELKEIKDKDAEPESQ